MAAIDPRKVSITDDDRGPIVNIVSWMCIVTMIMAVLTRLSLRLTASMRIALDDITVIIAMVLAVAHTVVLSKQVDHGLGERIDTLNDAQLRGYQKACYAADLLFVTACCFSKLSTTSLLQNLTPAKNWKQIIAVFVGFLCVWTLATFLALAFQCPMPKPWSILSQKCFDQNTFWKATGAIDIITELFMVVIPILFVKNLHMPYKRKMVVVFAFSFRVLVVVTTVIRLYYIDFALKSSDRTFNSYHFAIFTQVTMCLSIAVSCIPFLKSVMENMQSGLISNHGQHGVVAAASSQLGSYALKNLSNGKSHSSNMNSQTGPDVVQRVQPQQQKNIPITTPLNDDHNYLRDSESVTSVGSTNNIIKKPAGGSGDNC